MERRGGALCATPFVCARKRACGRACGRAGRARAGRARAGGCLRALGDCATARAARLPPLRVMKDTELEKL